MAAIDLSKAKHGDKFRTRGGEIVTFVGVCRASNNYKLRYDDGFDIVVRKDGRWSLAGEAGYDLIEQVFDEPQPEQQPEPQPQPSFELPKMDEFDKMGKELMQTLKSQLGGINNEQRLARRERIALTLIQVMEADCLVGLINDKAIQDNLKKLVDVVESIIGE